MHTNISKYKVGDSVRVGGLLAGDYVITKVRFDDFDNPIYTVATGDNYSGGYCLLRDTEIAGLTPKENN